MRLQLTALMAAGFLGAPALAQDAAGDPAAGEETFNRVCSQCHTIADADGNRIAGRGAKTGPNLYGLDGRQAGTDPDFRQYSDILVAAGEAGLMWTFEDLQKYVPDPTGYLVEYTGEKGRSRMNALRNVNDEDLANLWAFFSQHGGDAAATN